MIIKDPKQFKENQNLIGMNQTPFDYIQKQTEIRKFSEQKEKIPNRLEKANNLKHLQNENFARKFANPLSSVFKKGK